MLTSATSGNAEPRPCSRVGVQPDFSIAVPNHGYAWWYVDGVSDDGRYGLTLIAFVGSVFSPYYARARRIGAADPENHVSLNVCLYGKTAKRWTMTERGRASLRRSRDTYVVGPSSMRWDGNALAIEINEIAVPFPRKVTGLVRIYPQCTPGQEFVLDSAKTQIWQPIAPTARIEASFSSPSLSWTGHAYFDHNRGTIPLEKAFKCWDWSRQTAGDKTRILYDVTERSGATRNLSLEISKDGAICDFQPPPRTRLPSTLWRITRETRTDVGTTASVIDTLEDTPFYARSLLKTTCAGETAASVHESLDLDRFSSIIVQGMLPFRMPRRTT